MNETRTAQLKELRQIERQHGGIVHPADVVEFAKDKNTALHSAFEWDDGKAAESYRIWQARQLLRVLVEVVDQPNNETIRVNAFVSLKEDRLGTDNEGGYRYMPALMRTTQGRAAVLKTALCELETFQEKYSELEELADVFKAIKQIRAKRR